MSLTMTKTLCAVLLLVVLGMREFAFFHPGQAEEPASPQAAAVSAADRERTYRQFFTRTDQDGKLHNEEELDPPCTPTSKFLTNVESHQQALAVLDDFLNGQPETKMTPLERAILQHDLWAVLATTAGETKSEIRVDEIRGSVIADRSRQEDVGDAEAAQSRATPGDLPELSRPH